jgi:hypothetical protein
MRILLAALSAALLTALAASPAAADPTPDVGKMVTDDCAKATRAKKQCVLDFKGHEVEGGTPGATGTTVTVIGPIKHSSLIRVRKDFIQEILKTAEDL